MDYDGFGQMFPSNSENYPLIHEICLTMKPEKGLAW